MNNLKDYILEKFQITKDSKIFYSCCPKTVKELRNILEERLAENKDAYLNDIDVSNITNMSELFRDLDPHNIKIDQWNVSNVLESWAMFFGCVNFDTDLSGWDMPKNTNMSTMFKLCVKFKGTGLEHWNTSSVIKMFATFQGCRMFDCNLGDWDVRMFSKCTSFKGEGLEKWKVHSLTDMHDTFDECDSLIKKPKWYKG